MAKKSKEQTDKHRKVLEEARKRFKRCEDWEAAARTKFRDDVKFAEADAYNQFQWPEAIQNSRSMAKRPMLTVNRVRQHNLDIINDARQSRIAIKVRPVRGGATYEAAEIFDGVIKHIEYISSADSAYQMALAFAVKGGIGWIRVTTDYAGDDTFDQDIYIRPVPDPLTVYLDPDINEFDGSDAKFGFVFTDMPKEEFDREYPDLKDEAGDSELGPKESWANDETVRIAEYFRCVQDEARLVAFVDPQTGERKTLKESEIDKEMLASIIDNPESAIRSVVLTKVEHFKIIGDKVTEEKVWLGKYVPLIRCIGEETVIDGVLDRKGHTRSLIDSQRMFNYNISAGVEYGALQTKTPWVAPMAAIEENQGMWENANTENYGVLPYKHLDDDGNPIPAPSRIQPPTAAPVFMEGARDAMQWMYLASGQNQADFGQPGNEKSGVAINARQRQGDNATYHYLAHQANMVRFAGKQLIDLIPKVYDTPRMIKMRDEAGNESEVSVDPKAEAPAQKTPGEVVPGTEKETPEQIVFNPNVGVYDVEADVGPSYATRRQEGAEAFSQLLSANKDMFAIVGDIWMRFQDIPGGLEAAERLKRMVPQQALGKGPSPDLAAAQQQIAHLTQLLTTTSDRLASKEADHANDQEKNAIDAYKAQSGRLSAIKEALALDPQGLLRLVMVALDEAADTSGALHPALDTTPYIAPPTPEQIAPAMGGAMAPPVAPAPDGAPA